MRGSGGYDETFLAEGSTNLATRLRGVSEPRMDVDQRRKRTTQVPIKVSERSLDTSSRAARVSESHDRAGNIVRVIVTERAVVVPALSVGRPP